MEADLAERARRIEALAGEPGPESALALAEALHEPSWYLRERAVAALSRRSDGLDAVIAVVGAGPWFAKASGCDALGRIGDARALEALVARLLDRNVSVQKSAAEAVRALVELHGFPPLVRALESLAPPGRRATTARLAHQVPDLAAQIALSLSASAPVGGGADSEDDVAALRRFRAWLTTLSPRGENG